MDRRRAESVLKVVLVAAVASTALHYTDNAVRLDSYPGPGWISVPVIAVSWVLLTAVGLVGYRMFRTGRQTAAALCLAVYSATGISSLGHLSYAVSGYDALQVTLIATDGLTGLAVLACAGWIAAKPRTLRGIA